ncbi:ABC transporter permease [Clostridium polynesiense]|uniref:ABC transporter permease n=1 Tax=Clostridium polynesiense TaxID=1325933 RepID=UPI0011C7EAA3|nr:FtsX-like permease family protein [Clostridium polynesiense]
MREIGKDLNIITTEKDEYKHMNINGALLTLSGQSIYANVNDSLILLVIFLVTLVVISTILVIYNIFQISVMERITQIGILRSIGASPKQIKNMVFKEAFTLSIIGIPLGILSGVTASKILIYILSASSFNSFKGMSMYVNSKVILLSIILGSITVYFSARKPAKIAGRISPLEAVRNTGAIKNEKYKRIRSGRILRRIFGIEGELAYKNIKRNRRRFTVTVASLVISIVLFIVFNSFMNYTMRTNTSNVGMIFDMQIKSNNPFSEEYLKVLSQQPFIIKAYKQNINYAPAFIKSDKINTAYLEKSRYREGLMYNLQGENIIYFNGSSLYGYHKDFLDMTRNYVTQGEINEEEMNRVNGVVLVHDPRIYDPLERQVHNINLTNLQVGDEVILDLNGKIMESFNKDNKFPEIKPNNKFKIVAIAEQVPVTINKEDPINFITTEKVYADAMETDKFKHINIILNKDVKRDEAAASIKKLSPVDSDIVIEDFYERVKRQKQSKLIMSVFLYGFVSIIVLIGSLNILNTINTNLLLRKREFASLKAIGMSQRQVKKQIWIEGVLYGVIAAFWGSIIGGILSYLMYRIFNMMTSFDYSIPWMGMLIGSIGTIVITLLSSYPPLKRINNSNIIEAIKMEE